MIIAAVSFAKTYFQVLFSAALFRLTLLEPLVSSQPVSYRKLTAFFVPLALQTITQGSTHAIVAMVASRGEGGVLNYAGLSQAYKVMFFLGGIGAGLLTAGMVYGKTNKGYELFSRIARTTTAVVALIHACLCIPWVSHQIFGVLIGLPPAIELAARETFLLTIPLQTLFLLRTPYFAILFLKRATVRSYMATLGRVIITVLFAIIFVSTGLVGPRWAVVCMTFPVFLELLSLRRLALPYARNLEEHTGELPAWTEIISFSFMFSIGKFLIAMSDWILAAFISRAPDPERMLSVFAVATSIAGPIAFGASRTQALYVSFVDGERAHPKIKKFVAVVGLALGALPLVFIAPPFSTWYYQLMQNVPAADMQLVRVTAVALFPLPLLVAFRSYAEGNAAANKKPVAVLTGESSYLACTFVSALCALALGAPGNLIGPIGVWAGNISAAAAILYVLKSERLKRFRIAWSSLRARD